VKIASTGLPITKANETYQTLRSAIMSGEMAAGSRLRTNLLTKQYHISLSSLREALTQLSAEGLTRAEAHRGYTVSPVSIEDLADLTRVRIQVETLCLTWSIQNGNVEWESNIVAATHRLANTSRAADRAFTIRPWTDAHDIYHAALVSACGSPRLLQIRQQLYEQGERYRRLELTLPRNRDPNEEHRGLAEAAIARDVPLATRLMSEHINRTTDNIIKAMSSRGSAQRETVRASRGGKPSQVEKAGRRPAA
jgi:GntR family transcriptional regulator, carbon starvation induced regulator